MTRDPLLKDSIRDWWASNPMTYGAEHGRLEYVHPDGRSEYAEIGTARFFELADMVFAQWNQPHHDGDMFFGRVRLRARYRGRGVGDRLRHGLHGHELGAPGRACHSRRPEPTAVTQTRRRFEPVRA